MKQAAFGKTHIAQTGDSLQLVVIEELRPSVQQSLNNWIMAATMYLSFKGDSSPVKPSCETPTLTEILITHIRRDMKQKNQLTCA